MPEDELIQSHCVGEGTAVMKKVKNRGNPPFLRKSVPLKSVYPQVFSHLKKLRKTSPTKKNVLLKEGNRLLGIQPKVLVFGYRIWIPWIRVELTLIIPEKEMECPSFREVNVGTGSLFSRENPIGLKSDRR